MQYVPQSCELWSQESSYLGMLRHIERVARVSYRSASHDDIVTLKFVKSLWSNGHTRPLEFGSVWLTLSPSHPLYSLCCHYINVSHPWVYACSDPVDDTLYLSVNFLWVLQFLSLEVWDSIKEDASIVSYTPASEYHIPRITVHWCCSRGVADEFRTHVTLSSIMESTRYVNYQKQGLNIVKPAWVTNSAQEISFTSDISVAEMAYCNALCHGYTPQQAREFLPLCTATNLIQCGFPLAWKVFCNRRNDSHADANAHILAAQLQQLLSKDKLIDFSNRIY